MTLKKVYKLKAFNSYLYYIVTLFFCALFLLTVYGLINVIIAQIRLADQLSLTLGATAGSIALLITLGGMLLGFLLFIILFTLTINISIQVDDNGFRIFSLVYVSKWLTWDKLVKIRSFSLKGNNSIFQIGIDGLGWVFKLNGLIYWMYPYKAIVIGENSMENGSELLKIIKRNRPDLF